jgi:hypothetical protein
MDDVLRPFTDYFVMVYLYDILIFNRTWEEHMRHIQQVLSTLQQHKLYANLEKCSFGMNKVQYLGYIVDEYGVHFNPTNIQVICVCTALTTLTKLWSFLGLAKFYRRFVLGFSHIAWALCHVTKGGGKETFVWGKEQQLEFEDLKHRLCSGLVLSLIDMQHPFDIDTDASNYVVGAILTQQGHLIAYHSETLSDIVRNHYWTPSSLNPLLSTPK